MRPYEFFIGLRYLRAKRRNRFVSLITLVSALGIGVGVAALITVLSVMNGFQHELRDRILGVTSHLTVAQHFDSANWQGLIQRGRQHPMVVSGAPYIHQQAMLTRGQAVSGVMVRGIDPEWEGGVSDLPKDLVAGELAELQAGRFGVILGRVLAQQFALEVGDPVTLVAPSSQVTPAGMWPRMKRLRVVGIFDAGMYQYDSGLVYMHIADVQKLYRMGDRLSGVRFRLAEPMAAPAVARELRKELGVGYSIQDWTQRHRSFFRALRTEKLTMFVILSLIVFVAAFNIVSSLVMLVNEKRSNIAIFRTLGASPASITAIFMIQGTLIGLVGVGFGTVGGVALAWNVEGLVNGLERLLDVQFVSSEVYAISELPSQLRWLDVAWITGIGLLMSFLATIYPARRAARTDPVEALRYE